MIVFCNTKELSCVFCYLLAAFCWGGNLFCRFSAFFSLVYRYMYVYIRSVNLFNDQCVRFV